MAAIGRVLPAAMGRSHVVEAFPLSWVRCSAEPPR